MGLITHPHTSHNQSNWDITHTLSHTQSLQINLTWNTGYKRLNIITIKFGTEVKPIKHIIVNYNFTDINKGDIIINSNRKKKTNINIQFTKYHQMKQVPWVTIKNVTISREGANGCDVCSCKRLKPSHATTSREERYFTIIWVWFIILSIISNLIFYLALTRERSDVELELIGSYRFCFKKNFLQPNYYWKMY